MWWRLHRLRQGASLSESNPIIRPDGASPGKGADMKKFLLSTSLLALLPLPGAAQDTFDLGEITVFANKTTRETLRSGAVVEIVTEEDLQQNGTTQVVDTLRTLPGVSVSGNGGPGTSASLSVRGLPARYVPVYIDGIDVTDPSGTQTQYSFGALFNSGISRVEVLKGSQSALYGSEAIGGVVNITTLRATEPGTTYAASFEVGSFQTIAGSFSVATKGERGEIALTLSHYNTDGFSAADESDGNTEKDPFQSNQAILSGAYQATDALKLGFTLMVQDTNQNIDAFGGAFGDADKPFFTDREAARIYAEYDGDRIDHKLGFSYSNTERFDPTGFTQRFGGKRHELDYQATTEFRGVQLTFGASYSEEEFFADAITGQTDIAAIFIESQYSLGADTDLTLSRRLDDHSTFGTFQSNRAAIVHRLSDATRLRASIGNGFRAPSLYELFGPYGNTSLIPEQSRSAEVGIEHDFAGGAVVKATLFYTEIEDLIDFVTLTSFPDPFTGEYQQVPGTSRTRGLELSGELPVSDRVMVFGSYTYTDARDQGGNQLRRVPEHDFVLGLDAQITDKWSGQVTLNHVAGRADDGFPSAPQADYTVVNAGFGYAINDQAQAYVRIENLFDEEYQTSAGYATSDRAIYFGVRATF